ncbi:MAG: hypothetical protein EB141_11780 [Verrucomicrobia bacterium]|nr:hypothetical protein [Verrucomicrobiota bacterium]NBU08077.1 hypothetical protein [Pseudomonadota bacterium]NDA65179.1 hypothetical protein [Verrucomicrobiota bacterium]NDB76305.1 hypothetical protein [Verrucomicrobiota bacterium]NDD37132.1 hypothetical protein [Verrucomicrobiota bacterium]
MKKALLFSGVFLSGALVGAIAMWFKAVVPAGQGAEMIYASGVEEMARTATMIRQNKHQELLTNIDLTLPQLVEATHSFGDREHSRWALWKVKEYYQTCGVPVPAEISSILASLPPKPPKPPSSCELRRQVETNAVGTNDITTKNP